MRPSKTFRMVLALCAMGTLASCAPTPNKQEQEAAVESTTDPKSIVIEAIDAIFRRFDASAPERYFAETYIQHNPDFPSGLEPLHQFVKDRVGGYDRVRVIAEGDLVVTHSRFTGFGPKPVVAFDIFRVQDGKIAEHWDAILPEAETTVSGRTQLDGPADVRNRDQTAANRKLVQDFFADVLYGGKNDKLSTYISTETYHQHNPGVGDGLEGFGKALADLAKAGLTMEYKKTYRYIAEGNFVFAHSEGIFAGKHVAFADLFRVENGKIVEHWDVIQEVPEKTVSGLGMF